MVHFRAVRYRLVDYLTQGYLALVGLLILFFHGGRVPGWPLYVAAHVVCMAAIHLLIVSGERSGHRFLKLLRHFYPVILYALFYKEAGMLDQMFVQRHLDVFFLELEQRIFGGQPSLAFMARLPHLWVSEIFYLSYFSYYVMIVGVGLALYFKDREVCVHYVTMVSFIFYLCYLTYIFLPVVGPRAFYEDIPGFQQDISAYASGYVLTFPEAVRHGIFFRIMALIYRYFEPDGGEAFPSSHVAVAIATVFFSWQYLKKIRGFHLVVVVFLMMSTVYCRYHYAVDVLGGILTAAVLIPIGEVLYRRVDSRLLSTEARQ